MRIRNNSQALYAMNANFRNWDRMNKAIERLASGLRINRAADDAAGLSISQKMKAQIRGLEVAKRNALDAISLIQTAEGALGSMHDILQRIRELAVQAANDTNTTEDRAKIAGEMSQLSEQLDNILETTEYNQKKLLTGPVQAINFQIGANSGQTLQLVIDNTLLPDSTFVFGSAGVIGAVHVDLSNQANSEEVIRSVDEFINNVSEVRSNLGSLQNRLEHAINYLSIESENTTAAMSRVEDQDMAAGAMELVKSQILQQASTAMLVQANQSPQAVLRLLG